MANKPGGGVKRGKGKRGLRLPEDEFEAAHRTALRAAFKACRDWAVLNVLQYTGLTLAEVAGLEVSAYDRRTHWLRGEARGISAAKDIPLHGRNALHTWAVLRGEPIGPLFVHSVGPWHGRPKALTRQGIAHIVSALQIKSGVRTPRGRSDPTPFLTGIATGSPTEPAGAYLRRLNPSSRAAFKPALDRMAGMLSSGQQDAHQLPWATLEEKRYHWLREQLEQIYAPATARNYIMAAGGVLRTAVLLQQMPEERLEACLTILGLPLRGRLRGAQQLEARRRTNAAEELIKRQHAEERAELETVVDDMAKIATDGQQNAFELKWAEIDVERLRALREKLHRDLPPDQAKEYLNALGAILRTAVALGQITEDALEGVLQALALPRRRGKRGRCRRARRLTEEETWTVYNQVRKHDTEAALRDAALVAVTLDLGLPYAAAAALDMEDYDPRRAILHVKDDNDKGMHLKLPARAQAMLDAWVAFQNTESGPLFLWQPSPHRHSRRIKASTVKQAVSRRVREAVGERDDRA